MSLLFFDGAMGTELQRRTALDPMQANIHAPDAVTEIHRLYLAAGSNVLTANTFGAYPHKHKNFMEIIAAAIKNARNASEGHFVAMDMGPTGRLMRPMGDMTFDECYDIYRQSAQAGADSGADLILFETMTDLYEAKCGVLAAKETGLPVVVTVTLDERGRMLTGADLRAAATLFEGLGADAMGVNCGLGPDVYIPLVKDLLAFTNLPVLVQPNAGLPETVNGGAVYTLKPEAFAQSMREMAERGINMAGGCCGTTPEHIAALRKACGDKVFKKPLNFKEALSQMKNGKNLAPLSTRVSSGVKAVALTETTRVMRCRETNTDAIIDEAFELAEEADIIGITVTNPETVVAVQEMVRVPLLLQAGSPEVLRQAVRVYNGRPLVTVNDSALKKYGAVVYTQRT